MSTKSTEASWCDDKGKEDGHEDGVWKKKTEKYPGEEESRVDGGVTEDVHGDERRERA